MGEDHPRRRYRKDAVVKLASKSHKVSLPTDDRSEPTSARVLISRIASAFDGLPQELKKAARYITSHPNEVAFRSMRSIAKDAGVVPATMVRLTKAVGLQGFDELRLAFQAQIQARPQPLIDRARNLRASHPKSKWLDGVHDLIDEELKTVHDSVHSIHDRDFEKARELLAAARKVFVLGVRGMFPAAFCFCYSVAMFSDKAVLVDGSGGANLDPIRAIGPKDVAVVFTCRPYPRDVVRAVQFARQRGAEIIAVTDGPLSPAARVASLVFHVRPMTSSLLSSAVSNVLLAKILARVLLAAAVGSSVAAIRNADEQFAAFEVYGGD